MLFAAIPATYEIQLSKFVTKIANYTKTTYKTPETTLNIISKFLLSCLSPEPE